MKKNQPRRPVALLLAPALLASLATACKTKPVDIIENALPLERAAEAAASGRAVYATGKITAGDRGDPHFVKAGAHLLILRRGEIYAWVKKTRTVAKEVDGRKEQATEPYCELAWTRDPDEDITDNDWCQRESDEQNLPRRFFPDNDRTADLKITVGDKEYSVKGLPGFIDMPDLKLTRGDMSQPFHLRDGYFYHGSFDAENPEVGTERFYCLGKEYDREAEYTVVGALEDDVFKPLVKGKRSFLFLGAGGIEALVAAAPDKLEVMAPVQ